MNRYPRGPNIGGPSKATASTTCQKCLKKDNYECKAIVQERPYVSRPSRTQQLFNPKLVPKLTSDVPQDLLRKKGVADEQLAKLELERGRKRERQSEDPDSRGASKRMRSASSPSVSTISTNLSRSPSPRLSRDKRTPRSASLSRSPLREDQPHHGNPKSLSRPPLPGRDITDPERKRRRDSVSSVGSYSSENERYSRRDSRERPSSRSTRRKFKQISPPARGRRTESRSPHRGRRSMSNDRRRVQDQNKDRFNNGGRPPPRSDSRDNRAPAKERSLSPFSRRLALTQAMNMDR